MSSTETEEVSANESVSLSIDDSVGRYLRLSSASSKETLIPADG